LNKSHVSDGSTQDKSEASNDGPSRLLEEIMASNLSNKKKVAEKINKAAAWNRNLSLENKKVQASPKFNKNCYKPTNGYPKKPIVGKFINNKNYKQNQFQMNHYNMNNQRQQPLPQQNHYPYNAEPNYYQQCPQTPTSYDYQAHPQYDAYYPTDRQNYYTSDYPYQSEVHHGYTAPEYQNPVDPQYYYEYDYQGAYQMQEPVRQQQPEPVRQHQEPSEEVYWYYYDESYGNVDYNGGSEEYAYQNYEGMYQDQNAY